MRTYNEIESITERDEIILLFSNKKCNKPEREIKCMGYKEKDDE